MVCTALPGGSGLSLGNPRAPYTWDFKFRSDRNTQEKERAW